MYKMALKTRLLSVSVPFLVGLVPFMLLAFFMSSGLSQGPASNLYLLKLNVESHGYSGPFSTSTNYYGYYKIGVWGFCNGVDKADDTKGWITCANPSPSYSFNFTTIANSINTTEFQAYKDDSSLTSKYPKAKVVAHLSFALWFTSAAALAAALIASVFYGLNKMHPRRPL